MSKGSVHESPLTYDEAKKLAQHHDLAVRKTLAEREDIRPEILYYLAGDPSPEVRKVIARNKATPTRAFVELAHDSNDEIRMDLAQRIAQIAPSLTAYEVDRVQGYAYQALEILASDQLSKVRQILSETLKDVTQVSEELIKRLATDAVLAVACPILEHSPVLSEHDLLDIITSGISSGALGAISNRKSVTRSVSDAIVETNDVSAITTLLCNESAQIREETLDLLVERSESIDQWQGPLVQRPSLSNNAAQRLAEFVAENLLHDLKNRSDLSAKTLSKIRKEVNRRIEVSHKDQKEPSLNVQDVTNIALKDEYAWLFQQPPHIIARNLHRMNRLTKNVIVNALNEGDYDFVVAALAENAGVHLSVAQRMIAMRSARGVCALCWKAGLDAQSAVWIQAKIAHVPSGDILKDHNHDYVLSDEELQWQIDFFTNMAV
jgi:uncharacterized protein (DUF2336 family)